VGSHRHPWVSRVPGEGIPLSCRIGLLNVGGLEPHWDDVLAVCRDMDLDVLAMTETHIRGGVLPNRILADLMVEMSRSKRPTPPHGWKPDLYFKYANFQEMELGAPQLQAGHEFDLNRRGRGRGGVAIISFRPDITIRTVEASPLGVLSAALRKEGCLPLAVTVAYVPPLRRKEEWSVKLRHSTYDVIDRHLRRTGREYPGRRLLLGDFNSQLFDLSGARTSADGTRDRKGAMLGPSQRKPAPMLANLLHAHHILPIHGSQAVMTRGAASATTTSRVTTSTAPPGSSRDLRVDAEWGSEVDFMMMDRAGLESCIPLQTPPWSSTCPDFTFTTHRPLAAIVPFTPSLPSPGRDSRGASRRPVGVGHHHGGVGRPQARVRGLTLAPYGDGVWTTVGRSLLQALALKASSSGTMDNPMPTLAEVPPERASYEDVVGLLASAATPLTVSGAPPLPDQVLFILQKCGVRVHAGRNRTMSGKAPLPPVVGHLWDRYDSLRKGVAVLEKLARRDDHVAQRLGPFRQRDSARWVRHCGQVKGRHDDLVLLRSALTLARKAARKAAKDANKAFYRDLLSQVERLRQRDAHSLHSLLRRLSPETQCSPPDEDLQDFAQFEAYFRALVGQERSPPAVETEEGLAPQWSHFIGRAAATSVDREREGLPLAREVSWEEVYHVVFPPSPQVLPSRCDAVDGGPPCLPCKTYAEEHERWVAGMDTLKGRHSPPSYKPHLNTSRCGGLDGIPPELLCWPTTGELGADLELRKGLCTRLAAYMNSVLVTGRFPPEALQYVSSALFKPRDGAQASNPADYRFLTMGGVVTKCFDLVLCARLSHWASRYDLIGREQIGFKGAHSCPWHVLTLIETIKHRWRERKETFVLFVDLKKAYDRVHPATLLKILKLMGVPDRLLAVLRYKSSNRVTHLRMNGKLSGPIPMREGVGQGDPLSPLLFNIFIESLGRFLRSHPGLRGVSLVPRTVPGATAASPLGPLGAPPEPVRVMELLYADDIAVVADSPEQLQLALRLIHEWCVAFGMEMGTDAGKTEAMAFPLPTSGAESKGYTVAASSCDCGMPSPPSVPQPSPVPLTLPDSSATIRWTSEYRYLGLLINPQLCVCKVAKKATDTMKFLWFRYFVGNTKLLRHASPTLALQLIKTLVITSCSYLLDVVMPPPSTLKVLDDFILGCARWACRLSKKAPRSQVIAESRSFLALDFVLRDRSRLLLQMTSPSPAAEMGLARAVYGVLSWNEWSSAWERTLPRTSRQSPAGRRTAGAPFVPLSRTPSQSDVQLGSWARATSHLLFDAAKTLSTPFPASSGPLLPQGPLYMDPARNASLYTRQVAMARWHRAGNPESASLGDSAALSCPFGPSTRPPGPRGLDVLSYLYGAYRQPLRDALDWPVVTPMSVQGPGCTGGIISVIGRRLPEEYFQAIQNAKLGRLGLCMSPLVPRKLRFGDPKLRRRGASMPPPPEGTPLAVPEPGLPRDSWSALAHGTHPCPLCGTSPVTPFDSFHVLVECEHEAVVAARRLATSELPRLLPRISDDCAAARNAMEKVPWLGHGPTQVLPPGSVNILRATLDLNAIGWSSLEGRFCLFRLLCVCTWSAWHLANEGPLGSAPPCVSPPTPPDVPLSAMLAATFDSTRAHHCYLRPLAHAWARWAGAANLSICKAWGEAFVLSPLGQSFH